MSRLRPLSSVNHYKRLAVSLAVLAAFLLAVNIGLGVYCKSLLSHKTHVALQFCQKNCSDVKFAMFQTDSFEG